MNAKTLLDRDKHQISEFLTKSYVMIIPWHECPSPVYPSLQVQLWEPSVLVQFAVTSQAWLLLRHSSISGSTYDIDRIIRTKSVFMVFAHEIVV